MKKFPDPIDALVLKFIHSAALMGMIGPFACVGAVAMFQCVRRLPSLVLVVVMGASLMLSGPVFAHLHHHYHFTPPPRLPQVIYNGSRLDKRIALTFDACSSIHHSKVDKKIVHILVTDHVPATVFMGGKWALDQPKAAKYLASIPYIEIGNHSFHHPHLTRMSPAAIRRELLRAQQTIKKITGVTPRFFRAPYGEYNATVVKIAKSLGLRTVQFDLASGDPDKHFTASILDRWVLHKVRNGSIVVMHINTRGWHTAEALPTIIKTLRARGYQFVTISQLVDEPFPAPGPIEAHRKPAAATARVALHHAPSIKSDAKSPGRGG